MLLNCLLIEALYECFYSIDSTIGTCGDWVLERLHLDNEYKTHSFYQWIWILARTISGKQIVRKFPTLFLFTGVEQTVQEFVLDDWAAVTGCLFLAKILAFWSLFHCLGILFHSTRFQGQEIFLELGDCFRNAELISFKPRVNASSQGSMLPAMSRSYKLIFSLLLNSLTSECRSLLRTTRS